jgi:hydroxylamine dehydrogenase
MSVTLALALILAAADPAPQVETDRCAACHAGLEPGIVSDWHLSRHWRARVGCADCHGTTHVGPADVSMAQLPTVETCQRCHERQALQFLRGKHARAWTAVKALPTFHHLTPSKPEETASCAECHRIGTKSPGEVGLLQRAGANHGQASCDACHTRHLFSALEARQPEACRTCHGRLQYDAWAGSKHGVRHVLKLAGRLPSDAAAPTCQTCHMPEGDHTNRTPWGNLGLRTPLPEDKGWAADKLTLFVALGYLDAAGLPGPRHDAMESAGMATMDRIDYQNLRYKLTQACRQCHASGFIREQLDRRDGLVRKADALTAGAVREVAALYADGLLPKQGPGPFPDLVKAPLASPVEQRLATMFFDHRAGLMATAFHMSSESATWMSQVEGDYFAIQRQVDDLRAKAPRKK